MGGRNSTAVKVIRPNEELEDSFSESRGRPTPPGGSAPSKEGLERASQSRPEGQGVPLHVSPQGDYELEDQAGSRKRLSNDVVGWFKRRNGETLQGSLAFVPWILQQSYFESGLELEKIVMHRGSGAVVFSDASGFTALTERLAKRSNGAELLSDCLTAFFTPLINLINSYRGDVIKFSGDALMIYFPAVDDTKVTRSKMQVPPHGSYGKPDLGPMATAVLRASACCIEIQKRLHMFDTGVDGVKLCLHIGVGCGQVTILQVGGVVPPETHVPRSEYIIAGPPLEQIAVAEPLAHNGETCLSPQAWEHVKDCVIEDTSRTLAHPNYHLLLRMDETQYTFPTIKYFAMERDTRHEQQFKLSELNVIRRYIPSGVFKQIEGGTLTYVNEMRYISTIFVSGSGVDVSTDEGAPIAQDLMTSLQMICYSNEGTLNKFVIDDKGMLFLLVFGLPPLVHTDDPTRAVLACFDMVKVFKRLALTGKFGVTTGRAYCGVCGSASRMEYTVLGDPVNLSARLMFHAPKDGVLVDDRTCSLLSREVFCKTLQPIKVKGKENHISIYAPVKRDPPAHIGLDTNGLIHFPWYERPLSMAQQLSQSEDQLKIRLKHNVAQLCCIPTWDGIAKVQKLLGGYFEPELHSGPSKVEKSAARTAHAPPGSPFAEGGVVVIDGPTGMGKIELAEHMVVYSATHLETLPVFGSMGPRLNDIERLGVELLRSTVGVFRHLNGSGGLPEDDLQALEQVLPPRLQGGLPRVREAFLGQVPEERRQEVLNSIVELVVTLLDILRKQTSIIVVLQLEYGTNLFKKTLDCFNVFWNVVSALAKVAMPEGFDVSGLAKPVVLVVLAKDSDRSHPIVQTAIRKDWFVPLTGLSEENCIEYMAVYLKAPKAMVPQPLQNFITKISLGNPLYIRETVDQLLIHEHIKVQLNLDGQLESLTYEEDLEGINIAAWAQTNMVGETVCLLESLDPLEAAVLKMSTVFTGAFTLSDLASSSCSRWAGATHFDYLRLFRAIQDLVKRGIIEVAVSPGGKVSAGQSQAFEMRNVLIRKVGGSMVLEAQKKVVKRQALIERALSRDLPARMEQVYIKRLEPHIPWYYENVLAKS